MSDAVDAPAPPTLRALFLVFARISLTSFGGGLSGWMLREFVGARRWLTEDEFFDAQALSQALPGVNVCNMAIWIGTHLLGTRGALVSFAGIVAPASVAIVAIGMLFGLVAHDAWVAGALAGATAAAIALPLATAWRAACTLPRRPVPLLIALASFAAVAGAHLPVLWVVLVLGSVSIAASWMALGREVRK